MMRGAATPYGSVSASALEHELASEAVKLPRKDLAAAAQLCRKWTQILAKADLFAGKDSLKEWGSTGGGQETRNTSSSGGVGVGGVGAAYSCVRLAKGDPANINFFIQKVFIRDSVF